MRGMRIAAISAAERNEELMTIQVVLGAMQVVIGIILLMR